MKTMTMKIGRFAAYVQCSVVAFALMSVGASPAPAQENHQHTTQAAQQEDAAATQTSSNTLLKVVRAATERFKDVKVAMAEGYALNFGCVQGSDDGAMGMHFVNGDLVNSGVLDPTRPQIIIYEPMPNGELKLIGADFLVMADQWNKKYSSPPQLMGQLFHLFEAPNRFGLPAFYTLHVWAWKNNPRGAFTNWHPNVSCQSYDGQPR